MHAFLNTQNCVERLYKEYQKHKKLIVSVDFDDSVFPYGEIWSQPDYDTTEIWQLLRRCQKLGFYIVCWTASAPDRYDFIRQVFKENQVELASLNENPISLPFGNYKKIYYNILLDDRAGLNEAMEILEEVVIRAEKENGTYIAPQEWNGEIAGLK